VIGNYGMPSDVERGSSVPGGQKQAKGNSVKYDHRELIVQKWSGWKSKLEGRHISACKIFSTPTLCYPGMMAIEDTETFGR